MSNTAPTPAVVDVPTPSHTYQVEVGANNLASIARALRETTHAKQAVIISDSNIPEAYQTTVHDALAEVGIASSQHIFPAGEKHKRLSTLEGMLDACAAAELDRADAVVALGGGVTGDMAGLAGALYLRGIAVIQAPTTLLSMVDSSVGGKTAVDLASGKNLAGTFLQPHAVVADVATLSTLSFEQLQDGCGEVIKHAVLADEALLDALIAKPATDKNMSQQELIDLVATNIRIKRDVVVSDETEQGLRRVLNLGHTIGHAIEAASNFELGHGSCVAAGLCCIMRGALELGWTQNEALYHKIVAAVEAHGLPTSTNIAHKTLFTYAIHDKKRAAQHINIVLPQRVGEPEIRAVSLDDLKLLIEAGCTKERA